MDDLDPELLELARSARTVTVLSGAGMSAESGVPTFRDAGTGLWARWSPEDLATPEAWDADPGLVWSWYLWRARQVRRVRPNAGHRALARWADRARVHVVTQNVDDLHERAGSRRVHHIHGRLRSAWCTRCDDRHDWQGPLADGPACPACGASDLRPDIVWFGEIPYGMDLVEQALDACDLFVSIGTSGVVYPAAAFVHWARGATLELNLEPSAGATDFAESRRGPATHLVPAWVDELLA